MAVVPVGGVCNPGGVYERLKIHHCHSFDAHDSAGHIIFEGVFSWTRAIIEATVKPKRPSSSGDMCLPLRSQVVYVSWVMLPSCGGLVELRLNAPPLLC